MTKPRGRKTGEMKTRAEPADREKEYAALAKQLAKDNRMENKTAALRFVATVVDCERNLDTMREYDQRGELSAEERRSIVPFMKQREAALTALGLVDLAKKGNGFRRNE
jgi:hypothetical protein